MKAPMKVVSLAGLGALVALVSWAGAQTSQPASPALPSLPQGHPDISQMQKMQRPAPPMPPQDQPIPALPQGHPDISGLMKQQGLSPATTQPLSFGSVTIRATQGTAGGPAIAGDKVILRLYLQDNQLLDSIETKLDASGQAVVKDLPLKLPVQPVVTVVHADMEFQSAGPMLDSYHPQQQIILGVYETMEEASTCQIAMRHVMIQPENGTLHVHEMLMVENPTDRVWIGKVDAQGARATLTLSLPQDAGDIQGHEGFTDGSTRVEPGRLVHNQPLMPGTNRFQISYTVAPKGGQALLPIVANAPTRNLMVFLPASGCSARGEGLESGTQQTEDGQSMRYLRGQNLQADHPLTLTVSDFATAKVAVSYAPQIIAGVGGGLLLLVALAFFFIKTPKSVAKKA